MVTECSEFLFDFQPLGSRAITARFDGGMITSDGGEYYSKPMLSNALATKKQPAQLPMSTAEQMAASLPATVRTRTTITAIEGDDGR